MATNHTTNYALNLWEPTDAFLREEFNENTQKIDAALKDLTFGNCHIETGTYVGTGVYGGTEAQATVLHLGYRPKVLFVVPENGNNYVLMFVWPASAPLGLSYGDGISMMGKWLNDGAAWWLSNSYNKVALHQFNEQGTTYHYLALS